MKRGKMNPLGKNSNSAERRKWKRDLAIELQAITWCESCGKSYPPPTTMHALNRRYILTWEDYQRAAKVCLEEHQLQEYGSSTFTATKESMAAFVDKLIAARQ